MKAVLATAIDNNKESTPSLTRGETLDSLFRGNLQFFQSRAGYRFSVDALLLANFVTVKSGERVVDLGTGNGVISLALAHRYPSITVTGLEIQPGMVARARRNVRRNGLGNRVEIVAGDVRAVETLLEAASCDVVISNPPYRKTSSGRISPDREKQIARHEIAGHLDDFLRAAAYLLRAKGRLAVIYSAERSIELLAIMRSTLLEPKRLRTVHAFSDAPGVLVLVEAVKGGRAGVQVLAPLVIYRRGDKNQKYTDEVAAIIAGDSQ